MFLDLADCEAEPTRPANDYIPSFSFCHMYDVHTLVESLSERRVSLDSPCAA